MSHGMDESTGQCRGEGETTKEGGPLGRMECSRCVWAEHWR